MYLVFFFGVKFQNDFIFFCCLWLMLFLLINKSCILFLYQWYLLKDIVMFKTKDMTLMFFFLYRCLLYITAYETYSRVVGN